jgi:hypothetical protein
MGWKAGARAGPDHIQGVSPASAEPLEGPAVGVRAGRAARVGRAMGWVDRPAPGGRPGRASRWAAEGPLPHRPGAGEGLPGRPDPAALRGSPPIPARRLESHRAAPRRDRQPPGAAGCRADLPERFLLHPGPASPSLHPRAAPAGPSPRLRATPPETCGVKIRPGPRPWQRPSPISPPLRRARRAAPWRAAAAPRPPSAGRPARVVWGRRLGAHLANPHLGAHLANPHLGTHLANPRLGEAQPFLEETLLLAVPETDPPVRRRETCSPPGSAPGSAAA